MSEINENAQENPGTHDTGQETPGTENTTPASTSVLNLAIESVMDLIDGLHPFANITRGPLGISDSLSCEIAPSTTESVFMDKESYTPLTLALNGKHSNLQVLSDTLNNIMDTLTRLKSYPTGNGWQIVDITNGNAPRVIGREGNNSWVMACDIVIKIYRKDDTTNV